MERARIWLASSSGAWNPRILTCKLDLGDESSAREFTEIRLPSAEVVDSLREFCDLSLAGAHKNGIKQAPEAGLGIGSLSLIAVEATRVRELPLPNATIMVRSHEPVLRAAVGIAEITRLAESIRVRALGILAQFSRIHGGEQVWFMPNTGIQEATAKMRVFPQMRRSEEMARVDPEIRESFLREAEAVNRLTPGAGEVVAIFHKVPIAMISRYRFLEKRGVLLFTTVAIENPTRARVHDIAAVRDRVRKTTHLVAHRTRFATAFLS